MNRRQFASQVWAMGMASNPLLRNARARKLEPTLQLGRSADFSAPRMMALAPGQIQVARPTAAFPAAKTGGLYMYNYYLPPPSSTPLFPTWSPNGEEIAFSQQGSIWKIKVGENVAYELTADTTYDSSPAWSPDGKWIVYTAEEDSRNINLMMLELATGKTWPLTRGPDLNLDPAWSPDGSRIAFVSTFPDGWFNVFVMPIIDGRPGTPFQLTDANDFGRERLYFGRNDLHIEPIWSPVGNEIILVSNRGISLGSGAIWRMPAEANGMAKAKIIRREETLFQTRPDWSRDGARIVYSSYVGDQFNHLFLLPADGGEPYKLTFGDRCHFYPKWSPDGSRILYISNQSGLTDLRFLEILGGKETVVETEKRIHKRPMGRLKVAVVEAGKPAEARIYLRASDGKTYAPHNSAHRIGRAGEHLFYTKGTFEVEVPIGAVKVEAVKGIEYWPVSKEVLARPNEVTAPTLSISRMTNLGSQGWYSNSDHVHLSYGGIFHNTPETIMHLASAEDLSIICAVVANKDNRILDYQYFTGKVDRLSTSSRLLYFNEEYRPPFLGHLSLLNLKTHLISPFATGYEGTAIDGIYPSNTDVLRLARAEGAIGGYVHPFDNEPSTHGYARARGLPVDVALGTVDYLEVSSSADDFATSAVWHRLLNCGFKLPAVGGEDSENDLYRTAVVGSNRAYAHMGPKLAWAAYMEAIRRGVTFVTNGPLLEFSMAGRMLGSEVRLPSSGASIQVKAGMQCIVPVEKAEILNNGRVVKALSLSASGKTASFNGEIEAKGSGWYTLRAYTTRAVHPIEADYAFAETSPIYIYCGDSPIRSADDATYFITWIDTISKMAEADPGWRSAKDKEHVLAQFAQARQIYVRLRNQAD